MISKNRGSRDSCENGKRMGGVGSGRQSTRVTDRAMLRLDVRPFLKTPRRCTVRWSLREQCIASIRLDSFEDAKALRLEYNFRGESIAQSFSLAFTPCFFGECRAWVRCRCGRRVAVLYGAPFLCRHCHSLVYQSQRNPEWRRRFDRSLRIRERFSARDIVGGAVPGRPKGMHRSTYRRLIAQMEELDDFASRAALAAFS